jgi:hypothetical protein
MKLNELVKFICNAKFSPEFWKGKEVSHDKTLLASRLSIPKNRARQFSG